jgi:hypothetical protein
VPYYWERLWTDAAFLNALKCRWQELRKGTFSTTFLNARIKELADEIKPRAMARHFTRWPELRRAVLFNPCGKQVPDPCGPATAPVAEYFDYEVEWMRSWIDRRIRWLDQNLPGVCAAP